MHEVASGVDWRLPLGPPELWTGRDREPEGCSTIARVWRGETRAADADRYLAYLEETGARTMLGTPGNRGVQIWRRFLKDRSEFLVVLYWDSLDGIRAFAGDDYERAVYFPEDARYLLSLEPGVAHYEVMRGGPG